MRRCFSYEALACFFNQTYTLIMKQLILTKTELIECIIQGIESLENEQLARLYKEFFEDFHEDQIDWEE